MVASKSKKKTSVKVAAPRAEAKSETKKQSKQEEDILQAIDAISDEEDEGQLIPEDADNDDGSDGEEWDAEALALRKMISDGKFNDLIKNHDEKKKSKNESKAKADEVKEEELDEISDSDEDSEDEKMIENNEDSDKEEEDDSSDDGEEEQKPQTPQDNTRATALAFAILSCNRSLPFAESFCIVPPTPLPFGPPNTENSAVGMGDDEEEDNQRVDIHDDLKREVAFYDNALEAVNLAREQCEEVGIPFRRPDDFFAEMVKSDDHMAKIKDRLIFETKKIDAVQRRKSNKEQTLMAKERHAHRLAEKAKQKKDHMSAVQEWKRDAERGRGRLGGRVVDVEEEEERLRGVGKKRAAADKRYGFGGKRGRFKQNDQKTLNDMSGFKPRGGFVGGQKTVAGKGKGKNKRAGKRARDAARSGRY